MLVVIEVTQYYVINSVEICDELVTLAPRLQSRVIHEGIMCFTYFNRSTYVATMKLRCLVVLCMCVLTVCSKGEAWITFMTSLMNTGVHVQCSSWLY